MKRMDKKKKRIVISLGALLVAAGAIGVTFAMMRTNTQVAANTFSGGIVNVAVDEGGNIYETGANTYEKITAGTPAAKSVKIVNKDTDQKGNPLRTTDTYVRVRLVPVFRDENGGSVPIDMKEENIVYTYGDTENWKKQNADGETYYYYTKALAAGESTTELIQAVTYKGEVPEGATFELQVLTEGVAAKQANSLSAWGISDFDELDVVN